MKQKKFKKTLVLNKKTIAHLNGKEMKAALGGAVIPGVLVTLGFPYSCFCTIVEPFTCNCDSHFPEICQNPLETMECGAG
jgi:hypothetical protein